MNQSTISLVSFLNKFYGMNMDLKTTHANIKLHFPNIKRGSYKCISNEIIFVKDTKGYVLPYERPEIINYNLEKTLFEKELYPSYRITRSLIEEQIETIKTYQLQKIIKEIKTYSLIKEIKKEFIRRKITKPGYKGRLIEQIRLEEIAKERGKLL